MSETTVGPKDSSLRAVSDFLATVHGADAIVAAYPKVRPISASMFAAAADLPPEELEHMIGVLILLAITRRRAAGLPASDHEVRHLLASWLTGETDTCHPDTCRLTVGSDGSVTLVPVRP